MPLVIKWLPVLITTSYKNDRKFAKKLVQTKSVQNIADPENLSTHSWIRNKLYKHTKTCVSFHIIQNKLSEILKPAFPKVFLWTKCVWQTSLDCVLKIRVNMICWWFLLLHFLFERDLMKKSEICIFPDAEIFCAFPEKYFVKMRASVSREAGEWPDGLKGLTVHRHLLLSKRTTLLFKLLKTVFVKMKNVFVQITKCICPNHEMYLSSGEEMFGQVWL